MKLLSREEASKLKSAERKIEIDEGAKLAKKIDTLREAASKEEVTLAKFRTESIKKIQDEITEKYKEKQVIEKDIEKLNDKRKALRVPLDFEWERLKLKIRDQNEEDKNIKVKKGTLEVKERELESREFAIQDKEKLLQYKDASCAKNIILTEKYRNEADTELADARKIRLETDAYVSRKSSELHQREARIAAKERDLENREQGIVFKTKSLHELERSVNDKYKALLTAQEHVKRK